MLYTRFLQGLTLFPNDHTSTLGHDSLAKGFIPSCREQRKRSGSDEQPTFGEFGGPQIRSGHSHPTGGGFMGNISTVVILADGSRGTKMTSMWGSIPGILRPFNVSVLNASWQKKETMGFRWFAWRGQLAAFLLFLRCLSILKGTWPFTGPFRVAGSGGFALPCRKLRHCKGTR